MTANNPIRLELNDRNWIVAHYADGRDMVWGQGDTERGGKSKLTRYAKRLGMTKAADGRSAC